MGPTPSQVHVNAPLTQISVAYIQSAVNFVASRVFQTVPVSKQSDRYYTYDRGEFNRDTMAIRAPGTESAGGSYKLDNTPTYYCNIWALHKDIPDEVRGNADEVVHVDAETSEYLTGQALIRREKIFAANFFATGKWTTEYTGVDSGANNTSTFLRWNDANSNPIENIRYARSAVHILCGGFRPNVLVLGRRVYDALADHPDIIDRIKYGQTPGSPAMVTAQSMASLFEVEQVLVMDAVENTAKEGQTAVHALIGGKHALLVFVPSRPGLMTPAGGYTFAWTGMPGVGPEGNRITTLRMDPIKSDRLEIEMCFDMKQISADVGAFFLTIVA